MGTSQSSDSNERSSLAEQQGGELSTVKVEKNGHRDNDAKIKGLTRLITAESRRQADIRKDNYDLNKENMQILKHMFKKMDPSVMKTATHKNHGELQLSFKYEPTQDLLLVKVIKAKDLSAKDLRGKSADPYVRLYLFGLEDNEIKKTQIQRKTLQPIFHEIFAFPVNDDIMNSGKLVAQVWDHDIMDKDDFIGETIINLEAFDWHLQPIHTVWYPLQAETDLDITGDLEVTLAYRIPQTLLVTVHRANNLTNRYQGGAPNPFIKLQIPGIQTIHETKKEEGTTNPQWEETFEFTVPQEEFGYRYIILHCIDHDDSDKNDSLGQVIIDLSNFNLESGYHGSFDLADLKNSERLRSRWFQHATIQEFREALVAHAAFRYPKFLFGRKQDTTKVIKVSSRKAGCEAKLRIVNGFPVY